MSVTKLHPSLPAPVVHTSHMSPSASKSHVLAGVQDAYWSDDEQEKEDCPLCLEEMDLSDLNFKPCPCGYQICRFCWHHIKQNLNGRCPACRREYTDDAVQFKPVNKEDQKRLTQQKKQRERERKELDALGRRHLTNVRIVQRNMVYVVGLGSRFAKEELIPTLRSNDYFGQYGKITKMLLVKRTPTGGQTPILGLYISYYRREDAARAIHAVDGAPSPSGGGEIMRASYGTTKYCIAFLRGVSCTNHGCTDLHEWAEDKDCFTKEDLSTLKHTMKDTESRQRSIAVAKKSEESGGLPRSAGWGAKPPLGVLSTANASSTTARSARRGQRSGRSGAPGESRTQAATATKLASQAERKHTGKPPSLASSSRPSTPGLAGLPQRPSTPGASTVSSKQQKQRKDSLNPVPPRSPSSSVAVESDVGSLEAASASPSLSSQRVATPPVPPGVAPPGLPAVPPGLSSPPGIPGPASVQASSPLVREASASSYQISTQAQALLLDVVNRREALPSSTSFSPFPDLDRTLMNLAGGDGESGGFNFNLDPKLAADDEQFDATLPDLDSDQMLSPTSHFDPFSPSHIVNEPSSLYPTPGVPPGISPSRALFEGFRSSGIERTASTSSGYTGSFNPFGEAPEAGRSSRPQRPSPIPEDEHTRRVSRFGFARERQSSSGFLNSGRSSPLLSANTSLSSLSLAENGNPPSAASSHAPWPFQRPHDFPPPPGLGIPTRTGTPGSARASPLAPYAHAQTLPPQSQSSYTPQTSRFQPFDMSSSEASLKEMLGIGRDRGPAGRSAAPSDSQQGIPFHDPAIMSSVPYMPPPGNDGGFHFSPPLDNGFLSQRSQNKPPGIALQQQSQPFHAQQGPSSQGTFYAGLTNGPFNPTVTSQAPIQNQGPLAHVSSTPIPPRLPMEPQTQPESSPKQSPMLSAADFPALPSVKANSDTHSQPRSSQQTRDSSPATDEKTQTKLDRKAAKKAAAAEKAAERERILKEKAAERERVAKEKAEERERAAKAKAEEKERLAKEKAEKERLVREKAEREAEKERTEKDRQAALRKAESEKSEKLEKTPKGKGKGKQSKKSETAEKTETASKPPVEIEAPGPILSKMPKKNKPVAKPIKIPKENDTHHEPLSTISSTQPSEFATPKLTNSGEVTRSSSETEGYRSRSDGGPKTKPKTIAELLKEISLERGPYYLGSHPVFDKEKVDLSARIPIDYQTLARALYAFPAGGSSLADKSARLDDQTVAAFQQLLETLTQTMLEAVQLLPQSTWGSIFEFLSQDLKNLNSLQGSASFDGLVHDDLPEDAEDEENIDDLIGEQPTPMLEKRMKWMEIQLTKLEELHREVNAAAVRTIFASNDRGWDQKGILPHAGTTLARFEQLGLVDEGGQKRKMTVEELEKKLVVAKEAAIFAETEVREAMQAMLAYKP